MARSIGTRTSRTSVGSTRSRWGPCRVRGSSAARSTAFNRHAILALQSWPPLLFVLSFPFSRDHEGGDIEITNAQIDAKITNKEQKKRAVVAATKKDDVEVVRENYRNVCKRKRELKVPMLEMPKVLKMDGPSVESLAAGPRHNLLVATAATPSSVGKVVPGFVGLDVAVALLLMVSRSAGRYWHHVRPFKGVRFSVVYYKVADNRMEAQDDLQWPPIWMQ